MGKILHAAIARISLILRKIHRAPLIKQGIYNGIFFQYDLLK